MYMTNKKIDGFCQRSDSSPGTYYSTTGGDIDFCGDQTIPLQKCSLDVLQNHAERMNSKIYTILFNSSRERRSAVKIERYGA